MKRGIVAMAAGIVLFATVAGCVTRMSSTAVEPGWEVLIDNGRGLENFIGIGGANWREEGGAIVADKGKDGFLITKKSYGDFQIRAEFWADHTTNSGIFIRMTDRGNITSTNSYEVNVFDQRPETKYGTGAIVGVAAVDPMPKAGGRWNVYEITAKGPRLTVYLNGQKTADVEDRKLTAAGPFSLQYAIGANNTPGGAIKWRNLMVKPL